MDDQNEDGDAPDSTEPPAEDWAGPALPYSSVDFHNVVQKHVLNAVYETLVESKLDWALVAPFVTAARDLCRADFEEAADVRLHTVRAEGESWVEAEEAYLGLSVADRDDGHEWLTETWWLSDIATAEEDPEQVRAIVRALERSIAKINARLAAREAGGAAGPAEQDPPP